MNRYLTKKAEVSHWWDYPVIIASGLAGILAVQVSLESFDPSEAAVSILAGILVVALVLSPLALIVRRKRRQALAVKMSKAFDKSADDSIPLDQLDRRTGVSNAWKKAQKLLSSGYLQFIGLDEENYRLRLFGKPWMESDAQTEVAQTGNREFDEKIAEIRHMNDEIENRIVSRKIERIEAMTAEIFNLLCEKPERADDARRFMNYYLPTTMKLLESYSLMEKQRYQGDNIRVSRMKIEAALDKIIQAMERQHDKLFRSDAWDVESEITVLETMMAADGLTDQQGLTLPR